MLENTPRYDSCPKNRNKTGTRILQVRGGAPAVKVVSLSCRVCGVWTHFIAGRTYPCTAGIGEDGKTHVPCFFDHSLTSGRWQGWLCVMRPFQRGYYWLCLTEGAVRDCEFLSSGAGELRGVELAVARVGASNHSRLVVHATTTPRVKDGLPRPLPPGVFLSSVWGSPANWPRDYARAGQDVRAFAESWTCQRGAGADSAIEREGHSS